MALNIINKDEIQQLTIAECVRIIDEVESFRLELTSGIYQSYDDMQSAMVHRDKKTELYEQGANEAYHKMYEKLDKIMHPERSE